MYKRENELRLSEAIQQRMDECVIDDQDRYTMLLGEVQKTVLKGKKKKRIRKKNFNTK